MYKRCLIKTFQYIGGITKETLTDNMSSIVDTKKKEFYKEFKTFSKDIGFEPKNVNLNIHLLKVKMNPVIDL